MALAVFLIDCGGCGACGLEVWATIMHAPELVWANSPSSADVVVIAGTITQAAEAAVVDLLRQRGPVTALIVAGRCALTGAPFGLAGASDALAASTTTWREVGGCPPLPTAILEGVLTAAAAAKGRR